MGTRRHGEWMVLFSLGITGLLLMRLLDPAHFFIFPPCRLPFFTGLGCPGCGSLVAIHALHQGDLRQPWAMNALTVILLPLIGCSLISEIHSIFVGGPCRE